MSTKSLHRVEVKDADRGEVTAVFATLGVKDSDGDVTLPGAFEDGAEVVISAYGHTSWQGLLPVGKGTIREVGDEAILSSQFFMDTQAGKDTFTVVKNLGARGEWSYGYDPVKYSFGEHDGEQVRFLESLKVFEVSPVLLGAGVGTRTLAAKAAGLRFGDDISAVLAEVDRITVRAADVMAMRAEKGKGLSEDSRSLLEQLHSRVKALQTVLDDQVGESEASPLRAAIEAEFLRFTRPRA